jgi:hypothetical protein
MRDTVKKVVTRVKAAQGRLQTVLKNQDWVEDARKFAEREGKEVRKLLAGDVSRVKTFLERERKELEKIQKQIPGEVKKVRDYVQKQGKELEKLLSNVKKASAKEKSKAAGKTGTRKRSPKKAASSG